MRGGIFYSLKEQKLFVSTQLENDYVNDFKPRSKIVLKEMLGTTSSPQQTKVVGLKSEKTGSSSSQPTMVVELREEEEKETTVLSQEPSKPRRSGREIQLAVHYRKENKANIVVSDTNEDDPVSYKEAMVNSNKEKWQETMNQEMESMYSNSVCELVDPLKYVKPSGCK